MPKDQDRGDTQRQHIIDALRLAAGVVEQRKRIDKLLAVDAEDETVAHHDTVDAALKEMDRRWMKLEGALRRVGFTEEQLNP